MHKEMNDLLAEIRAEYDSADRAALHYHDGMVLVMQREAELRNRIDELAAENEKLRAQVAELLPWAWHHALNHRQGLPMLTRIEQGEFGEVAR